MKKEKDKFDRTTYYCVEWYKCTTTNYIDGMKINIYYLPYIVRLTQSVNIKVVKNLKFYF